MPPKTLYKNIRRLLIGGQLLIRFENDKCIIDSITHYKPPKENQQILSIDEGATELYKILSETVKRLEPSENETTVLLSGGMDSSLISKLYKEIFALDSSYSTGYPFESPELNIEKRYAISAAQALEMNHRYYEPSSKEFLVGILEAISYAEEPLHHLQAVLFHLLMKYEIPREQRIILCAQGAGSTYGYNEFFYLNEKRKKLLYRFLETNSSLSLLKLISKMVRRGKGFVSTMERFHHNYPLNHSENPIWFWMDYGNWDWVRTYFNVTANDIIKDRYEVIKEFSRMSMYDIWSRYSLYGDEDVTLGIWSKVGEGNKKILYYPYYDIDALNYAFSIPWHLKLQSYRALTKELSRKGKLPEFIINRPKSALSIHSPEWAKRGGVFEPLVPIVTKVLDEREIRQMQTSDWRNMSTFWNMVNYSIWKRLFINNEPLDVLFEELNITK
jgi:asparagine synthetase B (glutamine-hydrolysing)